VVRLEDTEILVALARTGVVLLSTPWVVHIQDRVVALAAAHHLHGVRAEMQVLHLVLLDTLPQRQLMALALEVDTAMLVLAQQGPPE
jgi:hypothetical protein